MTTTVANVGYTEIDPGTNTNVTTRTLQVYSDDAGDTITISSVPNPLSMGYRYHYTGTSLPGVGIDANALRVYGYGGDDEITLNNCLIAEVSGNVGDDRITLFNCNRVVIKALTPSDTSDGQPRPVDGSDTIDLQNSDRTIADAGDSNDTFTASGDSSNSILDGGPGLNDFAVGGTFSNGQILGGGDRDVISGSGDWSNATVSGGGGNDWIDLRPCTGAVSLYGGDGDDRMYAGSSGCILKGGFGFDWMEGGVGDDWFYAVDLDMDVVKGGADINGDHAYIDDPYPDGAEVDWITGIEYVE
jgi:hypothetical protein